MESLTELPLISTSPSEKLAPIIAVLPIGMWRCFWGFPAIPIKLPVVTIPPAPGPVAVPLQEQTPHAVAALSDIINISKLREYSDLFIVSLRV
jgi:hypothetical protein